MSRGDPPAPRRGLPGRPKACGRPAHLRPAGQSEPPILAGELQGLGEEPFEAAGRV